MSPMADGRTAETVDERLLELAAAHLRRFGLARATIVGIAQEAGMSHANVYRYFPSKLDLIDAVTQRWLRPLEADLRSIAEGPDPAYDKLERMLTAMHRTYRDKLEGDAALFEIFAQATVEGRGVVRKHRNRLQSEMQKVVEEGIAGGVFAPTDRGRALALIYDALHRFMHPVAVKLDAAVPRVQIDARFERVASLVVAALARGQTSEE